VIGMPSEISNDKRHKAGTDNFPAPVPPGTSTAAAIVGILFAILAAGFIVVGGLMNGGKDAADAVVVFGGTFAVIGGVVGWLGGKFAAHQIDPMASAGTAALKNGIAAFGLGSALGGLIGGYFGVLDALIGVLLGGIVLGLVGAVVGVIVRAVLRSSVRK
jgi:hypothetical protein